MDPYQPTWFFRGMDFYSEVETLQNQIKQEERQLIDALIEERKEIANLTWSSLERARVLREKSERLKRESQLDF